MTAPLNVAVIGVGRMGRHHARIYARLPQANLVAVVDTDLERAETVADECSCAAFASIEALIEKQPELSAVSIAVPTKLHLDTTRPLLQRRVACLVEKPLAPTLDDAKQLAACANECDAILQVGHTERFNPAVRAVIDMKLTPRFIQVDRVSPMTFRSLDTGAVMDMMIHDLDIVLILANSPIKQVEAAGAAMVGAHEDVANARIVFANGCVANLTASRLAMKTERKLRLASETAYVRLDYQDRSGIVIRRSDSNSRLLMQMREKVAAGENLEDLDYGDLIKFEQLNMDPGQGSEALDPLTAELISFVDSARTASQPEVTAQDGFAAVDAAERVIAAIHSHQWEGLPV